MDLRFHRKSKMLPCWRSEIAFTTSLNVLPIHSSPRPAISERPRGSRPRPAPVSMRSSAPREEENIGALSLPQNWPDRIARGARLLGLSAAATVTAAVLPPLMGRIAGRHMDTTPSPLLQMIQPANAAAKYSKKTLSEKLSQVPVFAVTNASGQPYLANMDGSGSQVGLIFFSHLDALNMLKDMQKNPGASDARVYIMGLDKAYEMVKAKPTPSGIRGSSGEELTMVFRFYPDSRQVKAAEGLARKLRLRGPVDGVPVFVAKGLTLRKGSENVVPIFLTKEDLDAAWTKLRENNKDLPNAAQVVVGNLLFIIQQMESGEMPELRNMGFFAPRASVEYVTKEQAGPMGQARMHQNPVSQQK